MAGVWNSPIRWREYMPQKPYEAPALQKHHPLILERAGGPPLSDAYLQFLVEELKPFIDKRYRTLPDQQNTFVMGSSMGGLISLYAISEYPQVFGGAGCVSTHWSAGREELVDEMARRLPRSSPITGFTSTLGQRLLMLSMNLISDEWMNNFARPVIAKMKTGSRSNSKAQSIPSGHGASGFTSRWSFC